MIFEDVMSEHTILAVDDEAHILHVVSLKLKNAGYTVLTANDAEEALELAATTPIHLLITDVILPDMSGRDLAERAKIIRPAMKYLFMSGYTADVIVHRGMLDKGAQFIPKPFAMKELAAKVRAALEKSE